MPGTEAAWPEASVQRPEMSSASWNAGMTHDFIEPPDGDIIRITAWRLPTTQYQCSLMLRNGNERLAFEQFFILTLRYGHAWFSINLAIGGAVRACMAHFDGAYTIEPLGNYAAFRGRPPNDIGWRANFNLAVYQPLLDRTPWL